MIELRRDLQGIPRVRGRRKTSCSARLSRQTDVMTVCSARSSTASIPASIVYEDDRVLAFNDINPQAPTHVLVIPKRHIATLNDLTPDDDAIVGEVVRRAAAIAARARNRGVGLPDGVQHEQRSGPDGLPHPPACHRRPADALAAGVIDVGSTLG